MKVMEMDVRLHSLVLFSLTVLAAPDVRNHGKHGHEHHNTTVRCSLLEYNSIAQCQKTMHHLLCRDGITRNWISKKTYDVTHITVLRWPGVCFHIGYFVQHYPNLHQLEFINCTELRVFDGKVHETNKIEKLIIHGSMSLWEVSSDIIESMSNLRELDLRNNVLRHIKENAIKGPPKLERVYLGGNNWDCSDNGFNWLAIEKDNGTIKRKIVDYYELECHQQFYRGKPLHKVMNIILTTLQTCPAPCNCKLTNVVTDARGNLVPLITVDCAGQGLQDPPASLPPSTSTLRLEGNKINTIRSIIQNPHYKTLADLYLDNNSISTVKELEGSEWFASFRVLSLRGNLLKQIPVYVFDKAFQGNNDIMHVYLGRNPWRCDCQFIPRFQTLLLKYKRVIPDQEDIRCSKSDDKKLSLIEIRSMPLSNVCRNEDDMPISKINIVNLVLLTLLLSVLFKFMYDWNNFKRTGKLPWISSILP